MQRGCLARASGSGSSRGAVSTAVARPGDASPVRGFGCRATVADTALVAYEVDRPPAAWTSARARLVGRRAATLGAAALIAGAIVVVGADDPRWLPVALPALGIEYLLYRLFALVDDEAARWRRGAAAEEQVGLALNELRSEGFHVVHDVEQPGEGNVDHLVSGPTGVYLVETKPRRYDSAHLVKAKRQAAKLHDALGVWVTPVICLAERRELEPWRHDGVWVVPLGRLLAWLRAQRNRPGPPLHS